MKYILLLISVLIITSCTSIKNTEPAQKSDASAETVIGKYQLHNIWLLESLKGEKIEKVGEGNKTPQLEIFVDKKQVLGSDGCNQIKGGLKVIDEKNIVFGGIMSTKKMCPNMETPNQFIKVLALVKTYTMIKLKLYFFDAAGKEIMQFKKID